MNMTENWITKKDMGQRFLSLAFHTRFFPGVLLNRLRPKGRARSGFFTFDHYVMLAVCLFLVIIATPKAGYQRSTVGWILFGFGLLGFVFLVAQSIASQWRERPSYDNFLVGFFFLFITLGLTAGIYAGTQRYSLVLGLLAGAAGLIAGYLLGIFAGLQFQRLGWLAVLLNILAGIVMIGLIIFDLMLLLG
jgi:hypothetical protein